MLAVAGGVCILFGIRHALNLGDAADTTAEKHRELGNPRRTLWPPGKLHNYRPQTALGVRRSGGLFVFVGSFFILLSLLIGL